METNNYWDITGAPDQLPQITTRDNHRIMTEEEYEDYLNSVEDLLLSDTSE